MAQSYIVPARDRVIFSSFTDGIETNNRLVNFIFFLLPGWCGSTPTVRAVGKVPRVRGVRVG